MSKLVHGTGNGKVVAQIEQILNNGGTGLSITKAMANMDTVTDIVAQIYSEQLIKHRIYI